MNEMDALFEVLITAIAHAQDEGPLLPVEEAAKVAAKSFAAGLAEYENVKAASATLRLDRQ